MAGLRKSLHWIAFALSAGLAPVLALAVFEAKELRTRNRKSIAGLLPSEGVVALVPRADVKRKANAPRPKGGAVILPFPQRAAPERTSVEPPALTGSR